MQAARVAFSSNAYEPCARPEYDFGEEQAANAAPSSEHWKLEPASEEENSKVGPVLFDGFAGLTSIVVFGAVLSIVTVCLEESSVFPAASRARARTW